MKVHLQIEICDGSLERVAELTIWLKDQIKQLPIESIEIPKASTLPEGARVADPFSWGALTVALAPTVVDQLFNLLRDRINRQKPLAKVVVECDGKKVSIEGTPDPQQLEATEKFLKDIGAARSERRAALLIACDDFVDPKYKRLSVSVSDARTLAKLLSDPEIGHFAVDLLVNEQRDVISERLEDFFGNARLDDVLLLYFAGHGDLDDMGNLYFIAENTKGDRLRSSGIPAQFIHETMVRSSSRSQILILDCCYSGAFSKGWVSRADASVGIRQKLTGEGRIVLTASEAIQFAYEKREPSGAVKSLFTSRIIEGMDGGQADLDGDGFISVDELYKYVEERIRSEDPSQRPLKSGLVHGELWLGRAVPRKDAIPRAVIDLLNHILKDVRIAGIGEVQNLVSANEALYPAAVLVLTKMLSDRDTTVQLVAGDVLQRLEAKRREREEKERLEAERLERLEKERLEAERCETEKKERLEAERRAKEKQERWEAERRQREEQERLEVLRQEKKRQDRERLAREQREKERLDAERQERLEKAADAGDAHAMNNLGLMNPELQAKLDEAAKRAKGRDNKAEAIIWTNVLFNAGMGVVPLGINVWTFVGSNVTGIIALGHLYGFTTDRAQAGALIKQIFRAAGMTWVATVLGLKFFSEVLKGVGVFAMGGPTVAGLALDAVLSGAVSYALGYTARAYFSRGCTLEKAEMRKEFRTRFDEGKAKVAAARKAKETLS